ncbi:MAG TPA: OsmC family protein [Vitreimonas sp.]|nr:OsmC family protein [Vitreimonas sp.]
MSGSGIRDAITGAREYLGAHRDEARYRDSSATATVESGLRVRTVAPDGAEVMTDMTTGIGGAASAPSAGWLLRAANASCIATLIAMRAAEEGVALEGLEVTVDSESDDYGILGIDETVPAGPLSMRVAVRVGSADAPEEKVREIIDWGIRHCPVCDAVKRAVPVEVDIAVG